MILKQSGSVLLSLLSMPSCVANVPVPDAGEVAPVTEATPVTVVASRPRLHEMDVYPAPLEPSLGQVVRITVEFSEAMVPTSTVHFSSDGGARTIETRWSDNRHLEAVIQPPAFGGAPLADDTVYSLDLSPLMSANGTPLQPDAGLLDGRLVFTTGQLDTLLNHSCGHVQFGPFKSVTALAEPSLLAPGTDTPHTQYTIGLPATGGGAWEGFTRFDVPAKGRFTLFLAQPTDITVHRDSVAAEPLVAAATPPACDGISQRVSFAAEGAEQLQLELGARAAEIRLVVEAEYE